MPSEIIRENRSSSNGLNLLNITSGYFYRIFKHSAILISYNIPYSEYNLVKEFLREENKFVF